MKARILIVDDHPPTREVLGQMLAHKGFEVSLAAGTEEFRAQAFAQPPDLVILDIMLGDHNGALFYETLLAEGLERRIPVIFISGLLQDRPPAPGLPGRRYALRAKPFRFEDLMNDISTLLVAN
jgi:DNA-binding response OmpR family regulator